MTEIEQLSAALGEVAERINKSIEWVKENFAEALEKFYEGYSDFLIEVETIFDERERIRPSYKTPVRLPAVRRPRPLWRKNRAVFRPYKLKLEDNLKSIRAGGKYAY